jgi:tetratricopeptide (TPR) repeat protein
MKYPYKISTIIPARNEEKFIGETLSSLLKQDVIQNRILVVNDGSVVYLNLGDYNAALSDFNIALELDPNYANAYVGRGSIYYALGDNEAALADWSQAETLGYTLPAEVENIAIVCSKPV